MIADYADSLIWKLVYTIFHSTIDRLDAGELV